MSFFKKGVDECQDFLANLQAEMMSSDEEEEDEDEEDKDDDVVSCERDAKRARQR